jgi:hypothetical protein
VRAIGFITAFDYIPFSFGIGLEIIIIIIIDFTKHLASLVIAG